MSFAERMGFVPTKPIQIDSIDEALKNRLYNFFFDTFYTNDIKRYILDKMGQILPSLSSNLENHLLSDLFLESAPWYNPYDIYEYLFEFIMDDTKGNNRYFPSINNCMEEINKILSEEKSGYRMVDGKFVAITNEIELEAIQSAKHTVYESVNEHIKKALERYSDRKKPDYENTIKESISAVESMCCIITNSKGSDATLSAALKKLEDNGVKLHGALKSAFDKLYGYTSDQGGIRHGSIDFINAPEEDARYMLVTCSAFVNYLIEKYTQTKNGGTP